MRQDLWKFAIVLSLAAGIGFLLGYPLLCILIATALLLGWQSYQIRMVLTWLRNNQRTSPAIDSSGSVYQLYRLAAKHQRKAAQRKIQVLELVDQLKNATAALPDAIVLIDERHKIEWANQNAKQLLGIQWPQDAQVKFSDLMRYPEVEDLLANADPQYHGVKVSSLLNRGTTLNLQCVPYAKASKMIIARDISHLLKVNKIHTDFVANVSHELKTPLTVLRGYLEILADSSATPDAFRKPIEQMNLQSSRMQLIVDDLLYLAKLEDSQNRADMQAVNVANLLNTIIEAVQPLVDKKGHEITMNVDSELALRGDQSELYSAFLNLVSNAIKYTPAQGSIKIAWQAQHGDSVFSVEDNGYGIDEHHLDSLTKRFYRVDNDRSRDNGGTGLGLAIVKHVLQRHDAKLMIQSRVDRGSKFSCVFASS